MCEFLGVSRSGYYDWRKRGLPERTKTDSQLKPIIQSIYDDGKGAYGSPRIFKALKKQGYAIGRKRVERLMRELRGQRTKGSRTKGSKTKGSSDELIYF